MNKGQELKKGQNLLSENGKFKLELQTNGNLVIKYNEITIWSTDTSGRGERFVMQNDGNAVLYDINNRSLFTTQISINNDSDYIIIQNDGNLALFTGNRVVWTSNSAQGINLLFFFR